MDELIDSFEYRLAEPDCMPGVGRYGVVVTFPSDISAVFPYLNAVLDDTWYDHKNHVLIAGEKHQRYAFRPNEIRVAGVADQSQAQQAVSQIVDRVNRVWQKRDSISPCFTERKLPTVIDIYQLLPRTNCRQCGYLTCLAFAADLRSGVAQAEQCPCLSQPDRARNKERILSLFASNDNQGRTG